MRVTFVIEILTALAVVVSAAPSNDRSIAKRATYSIHETRDRLPRHWHRSLKVPQHARIPVRIGLTQQNLDQAEEYLNDVSHPSSPNYGKHWTSEEVARTFAASDETVKSVKSWLADWGIEEERIQMSKSLNWLIFNATAREVEEMLDTSYHVYQHKEGHLHIACESYSLPAHIREHVDIITPTVHFDAKIGKGRKQQYSPLPHESLKARDTMMNGKLGSATDGSNPKQGNLILNALASLDTCDTMITPACLQALYSIPNGKTAITNNTLGIVEYTPQAFLQTDLEGFFEQFSPSLSGQTPIQKLIDGAIVQNEEQSFSFNGESALDLEYAMALISPQQSTLFQVGDTVEGASFNNFLDAIDGTYCTFRGGDSSTFDATYPDTEDGGFEGDEDCGTVASTNVISTSYSSNEHDLTASYERRQCHEYLKLGLQGVSVLYSSGDYGVAGNGGECIDADTGAYNNGTSGLFNPSFPGVCPYITSVGATQLREGSSVTDAETASETVIFSGGGFSNVFAMPKYQEDALSTYFNDHAPSYGSDRFNNSQTVRGYPDVSANGANYVVVVDGNFTLTFGTSASCPVFASMLTLINEERLAANKSSVGFINPTLYENPQVMNDITKGGNQGCGTAGFESVAGWDPVTGLGTPNYPDLLSLFMSLP